MSNRGLAQDMTPVLQASLMLSAHEQGGKKVPHAGEHTWGPLGVQMRVGGPAVLQVGA